MYCCGSGWKRSLETVGVDFSPLLIKNCELREPYSGFQVCKLKVSRGYLMMNRKLAIVLFALPFGMSAALTRSASATDQLDRHPPVVVAQRYDEHDERWNNDPRYDNQRDRNQQYKDHRNRNQRHEDRRNRDRREAIRREQLRKNELRRQDGSRRNDSRWEQNRRDNVRWDRNRPIDSRWDRNRQNIRRVWIPGHYERGFLGIGRRWVEGHWETR